MKARTLDDLHLGVRDPEGLRDVLDRLVAGVRECLRGDFLAAWLQGSLATGDFEDLSDVDFIVAVREDPAPARVASLRAVHHSLFDHPSDWAWHLEGSYIPAHLLTTLPPPRRKVLYIDHGATAFERSDHDHSLVVSWSLRERGVTLAGPPPRTLIPPIPQAALETEVRQTLREWSRSLLEDEMQRWLQAFAVMSLCRMAETLATGEIRSKRAGVAWARKNVHPRWHDLIDRAWAERARATEESHRLADPDLVAETRDFVRHVLAVLGIWPQGSCG